MRKRTIVSSHVDWKQKTAYVKNQGIEELSIFKKLKDNGIELKDEGISDDELCMLLNYLCEDGIIECIFSIENSFNRDQKSINCIKRNIEEKWKAKGLEIITHCDWSPSFKYDTDVINSRNYLTVLCENIEEKKRKISELGKEFELREKNMNKELIKAKNELERNIEENKQKIKQQKLYIEQKMDIEREYLDIKEKLNKEIERYKKGKEYNDNFFNRLPDEVKRLLESKNHIEGMIEELSKKLRVLEDENIQIKKDIELEKKTYDKIKNQELTELMNEIKKVIMSSDWSKKEAYDRFERACQMYLLNGRNVPGFEIENATREGLSENEIVIILNKYI